MERYIHFVSVQLLFFVVFVVVLLYFFLETFGSLQPADDRFHTLPRLEAAEGAAVLPVAAVEPAAGPVAGPAVAGLAVAGLAVAEQQLVDAAEQPA